LYGFNVVATCSPHHFDRVRSLGANHVFDYRDDAIVDKIKNAAPGLKYVFDTIGREGTSALASQAIDPKGGNLCTVRPGKAHTDDVSKQTKVTDVLVWTAFLRDHRYGSFYWPVRNFCDENVCTTDFGIGEQNRS
jgi:NADPH:quinone reductase-like Zn-dependent oxidoreductase